MAEYDDPESGYPLSGKFTVVAVQRKPGTKKTKFGDMKTVLLELLDSNETVHKGAEWFTNEKSKEPAVNDQVEGELSIGQYGLSFKKPRGGGGGGGGGGRSPGETKAIQRQHSQEMALRYHDTLVRTGARPWNLEQVHQMTDWFETDISGKQPPIVFDPLKSDIPIDTTDLPPVAP